MAEDKNQCKSSISEKDKIRQRYKGASLDDVEIIPALPEENIFDANKIQRVGVYVRVSTDDPRQTSSFELQKNHYTDFVNRHHNWELVDIYADEGISGTSLQHREAFLRMIEDCNAGKIDLIVTKSVSRFARNILDCIGYVRQLASMTPSIGVIFETENIYTLDGSSEMILSFMATMAQEESHNKSEIMNASIEMRFRRKILLTPPLLGYDQDEDGKLIVNQKEAVIVRLIFFMYLYGYTCVQIAEILTELEQPTKKNNIKWSPGSILQILQNERHCGDVLARKTWTPNYLDHKARKNKENRNQYRWRNQHEPIVSRDDYIAVQRLISNARYGNKGILPKLHVIHDGVLNGFVGINPRWAAFSADDYHMASGSIQTNINKTDSEDIQVKAQLGDFDLRGFEIARSQFFDTSKKVCVTFSLDYIVFSSACIQKLDQSLFVELLVHPKDQIIAVRSCTGDIRNAIKWAKSNDGQQSPRSISCAAYIKTLYSLFNWNISCKYRVQGIYKKKEKEEVLVFDMHDTEIFIPQNSFALSNETNAGEDSFPENINPFTNGPQKDVMAYPASWANSFGYGFYHHAQAQELISFDRFGRWNVYEQGLEFSEPDSLNITNVEVIGEEIKQIICNMQQEKERNGKGNS